MKKGVKEIYTVDILSGRARPEDIPRAEDVHTAEELKEDEEYEQRHRGEWDIKARVAKRKWAERLKKREEEKKKQQE